MPNHVHLIAVPQTADGLRKAIGEAHKNYAEKVNHREGWRGHLWQGRFSSYALDETYLKIAARYIILNPVRARIVKAPEEYPWSSAPAHLDGRDDLLVRVRPLLELAGDWKSFLSSPISSREQHTLRRHEGTGRPLGDTRFIHLLEQTLARELQPKKRGPKLRTFPELDEDLPNHE